MGFGVIDMSSVRLKKSAPEKQTGSVPEKASEQLHQSSPVLLTHAAAGSAKLSRTLSALPLGAGQNFGAPSSPTGSFTKAASGSGAAKQQSGLDALLQWCKDKTSDYQGVSVTNFTTSWKDGKAFYALGNAPSLSLSLFHCCFAMVLN